MTSDNLRSFVLISLASVLLIFLVYIFAFKRAPAIRVVIPVTHVRTFPLGDCYDDRPVWVFLLKDGTIRINETPISQNELKLQISQIYENRQDPNAAFMRVDPEVPYARFLDAYNEVVSATHGLHVGVMTEDLERRLEACPSGASCGLEWPDHQYIPWCLNFNIPPVVNLHSPLRQR